MKKTTSLCFSPQGLLNQEALEYLQEKDDNIAVVFCDGSKDAFASMINFNYRAIHNRVNSILVGKTPLYELKVKHPDGSLSRPQYVQTDSLRINWVCSRICTSYIKISISDVTSQSGTQTKLDHNETRLVCYNAYTLWAAMREAEDRFCFPAIVIDRMTRWTYSLQPDTIDLALLRKESGFNTLDYNHQTDLLSITVGGDIFSVKLNVLQSFYSDYILPLFNTMYGRRLRILVSVAGSTGQFCDAVDMSYGELGQLVEEMESWAYTRVITQDHPLSSDDLLAFAKKVKINEDSCYWPTPNQTIGEALLHHYPSLVRSPSDIDIAASGKLKGSSILFS